MSERGSYAPEALQKKPEDESKDWKEHQAFDRALAERPGVQSPEQSLHNPVALGSGDVNNQFKPGVGENSSAQQSDSSNASGKNDNNSGYQQTGDQTNPTKPGDDPTQQNKVDAEKLRQVREELSQIRRNRHDSLRR